MNAGDGLPGLVWESAKVTTLSDVQNNKQFIRNEAAANAGLRTAMAMPLIQNEEVIAVLMLASYADNIEMERSDEFYDRFTQHLALLIQKKKKEEELNRFFELSPDVLCVVGMDGYFKKINSGATEAYGYSEKELLSRSFLQFTHPDDRPGVLELLNKVRSGKNPDSYFEIRIIAKTGDVRWLAWTYNYSKQEGLLYAVGKDITDKKESEQLLGKTNEQLKTALRIAKLGYWTHNLVNNKSEWSEELYNIWEQDPDNFEPGFDTLLDTIHPDDQHMFLTSAEKAFPNKKYYDNEHRIITPDGKVKWILERITLQRDDKGNPIRMEGIAQDITEEKQLKSERDKVLDSITDGFLGVNNDWEVTYWNNAAEQILKIRREDIIGKNFWIEFQQNMGDQFSEELHKAMKSSKPHSFEEYYEALGLWFETSTYPIEGGLSIFFKDITNSKQQELEIVNIKNNREALINSTEDLIWSIDLDCKLISANKAFKAMLKDQFEVYIEEGEILELAYLDEESEGRWNDYYRRAFEGEKFTITEEGTYGEITIYSLISFNPIWNNNGNCVGVACFSKDITERMQHITAIESQNKVLREIAWNQSHVVRAPLAKIMGLSELIRTNHLNKTERDNAMQMVTKSANELDEVLREMVKRSESMDHN